MTLAVGIGVLSLAVWAVNGTLSVPGTAGEALAVSTSRAVGTHTVGHPSTPSPAPSGRGGPSPTPRKTSRGRQSRSSASPSPAPSPAPGVTTRAGSTTGDIKGLSACPPGSVVLSLSSPQYWYTSGQLPRFTVDVVSTGSKACRFDVGTRSLAVVVATGRSTVWSSSYCARAGLSREVALSRGVPVSVQVTWDRRTSSPGCLGARKTVPPGSFTATAVSGALRSPARIFVLGAAGLAVP